MCTHCRYPRCTHCRYSRPRAWVRCSPHYYFTSSSRRARSAFQSQSAVRCSGVECMAAQLSAAQRSSAQGDAGRGEAWHGRVGRGRAVRCGAGEGRARRGRAVPLSLSHLRMELSPTSLVHVRSGRSRGAVFSEAVAFSAATPIGVLIGTLSSASISPAASCLITALSSGTFIYISLVEILQVEL